MERSGLDGGTRELATAPCPGGTGDGDGDGHCLSLTRTLASVTLGKVEVTPGCHLERRDGVTWTAWRGGSVPAAARPRAGGSG